MHATLACYSCQFAIICYLWFPQRFLTIKALPSLEHDTDAVRVHHHGDIQEEEI